jgi:phosphate-selective porin OprO/OprP
MNQFLKYSTLAAFIGASIGAAQADSVETKGGLKIKTDDGRFEMSIGGRIMFDGYILDEDKDSTFGSGAASQDAKSSTYFRRLYLTLKGKAYGWNYKFEPDFAGNSTNNSAQASSCTTSTATPPVTSCTTNNNGSRDIAFQDVYISHAFGPGGEVFIGQMKPFRGMEELTSSNDITMMERPFASAAGIFNGGSSREFQQGIFYKMDVSDFLLGAAFFDLRRDNTRPTEGLGYNARAVYAPLRADGGTLHVAVSYSDENPQKNGNDSTSIDNIGSSFIYAGRRGPNQSFGATTGGEHAKTIGGELAGSFGPATLQAEFMDQKLGQAAGSDLDVQAWYVQASVFVTGESRPYKKGEGTFGQPKPKADFGAIELAARYDYAENKDIGCGAAGATQCEATSITLGANYYLNPNVRFMLNYIMGELDSGTAKDKPNAITARAQFSF